MSEQPLSGDGTPRWRESYRRVRKNLLSGTDSTNRARLRLLGVTALARSARLLDLGAGDGNVARTLRGAGFHDVWGLEMQRALVAGAPHLPPGGIVVASGVDIPFAAAAFDAVVIMDVLHHIAPADWAACLADARRVLRPSGTLFVCEPAATVLRQMLTGILMSPLAGLSSFSRDKRAMVEEEREELDAWLARERAMPALVEAAGFETQLFHRAWLHHYGRFRRAC